MTSLGRDAFYKCSRLTGTMEAGTGRTVITFAVDGSNNSNAFRDTSITNAVIGPNLAQVPGYVFYGVGLRTITFHSAPQIRNYAFQNCTSVRDVFFIGEKPASIASAAFSGWSSGQARLHLPKDSAEWKEWADANTTSWYDLSDDTRDSYWDRWPKGKKPYGRSKSNTDYIPANQWVLGWVPPGRGTVIMVR